MEPAGIVVESVPHGLSSDVVRQYFFSRGGEIKAFRMHADERKAFVEFENSSGVL